jgi:hypothetical protein
MSDQEQVITFLATVSLRRVWFTDDRKRKFWVEYSPATWFDATAQYRRLKAAGQAEAGIAYLLLSLLTAWGLRDTIDAKALSALGVGASTRIFTAISNDLAMAIDRAGLAITALAAASESE